MAAPEGAVLAFPRGGEPGPPAASPSAAAALAARIERSRRGPTPRAVPAEAVSLMRVDLPVQGARRRLMALPFAVEERVAAPLESVHVASAPRLEGGASVLAAVVARRDMEAALAEAGAGRPLVPEAMAIARPAPRADGGPAWAVWRDGARAVVRVSDGTGFAVRADALVALWARAGRPEATSLGMALPIEMGARDLADEPPPPDPADLAFDLRQGAFAAADAGWARPLRTAALVAAVGLASHLAIAAADLGALRRIAGDERRIAQAAVAPLLPGIEVGRDPGPLLARLAPAPEAAGGSDFLPLLSEASAALLSGGPELTLRRLAWGAQDGRLLLLVQSRDLEDLQQAERALKTAGLSAESGTATAGEGGAEAEIHISRSGEARP